MQPGLWRRIQACAIDHGRVEGNGIPEILAVFNHIHIHYEGLAGRDVEGINRSEEKTQENQMPDTDNERLL